MLTKTVAWMSEARDRIAEIAAANGLHSLPSAANFVAVDCATMAISPAWS